jgi:hypothetical protein
MPKKHDFSISPNRCIPCPYAEEAVLIYLGPSLSHEVRTEAAQASLLSPTKAGVGRPSPPSKSAGHTREFDAPVPFPRRLTARRRAWAHSSTSRGSGAMGGADRRSKAEDIGTLLSLLRQHDYGRRRHSGCSLSDALHRRPCRDSLCLSLKLRLLGNFASTEHGKNTLCFSPKYKIVYFFFVHGRPTIPF